MKNTKKKEPGFAEEIFQKLESIGEVYFIENFLLKDGKKFAMVKNNTVHLIDKNGNFNKINKDTIQNTDAFLKAATESYWIASGKI